MKQCKATSHYNSWWRATVSYVKGGWQHSYTNYIDNIVIWSHLHFSWWSVGCLLQSLFFQAQVQLSAFVPTRLFCVLTLSSFKFCNPFCCSLLGGVISLVCNKDWHPLMHEIDSGPRDSIGYIISEIIPGEMQEQELFFIGVGYQWNCLTYTCCALPMLVQTVHDI